MYISFKLSNDLGTATSGIRKFAWSSLNVHVICSHFDFDAVECIFTRFF